MERKRGGSWAKKEKGETLGKFKKKNLFTSKAVFSVQPLKDPEGHLYGRKWTANTKQKGRGSVIGKVLRWADITYLFFPSIPRLSAPADAASVVLFGWKRRADSNNMPASLPNSCSAPLIVLKEWDFLAVLPQRKGQQLPLLDHIQCAFHKHT